MNEVISYEEFEKHLTAVKDTMDFQDEFSTLVSKYGGDCFTLPERLDSIVQLLQIVMDDKEEWIEYFVYETDFGRARGYGGVVFINGDPIELKTIEDLWNILDMRDDKNED